MCRQELRFGLQAATAAKEEEMTKRRFLTGVLAIALVLGMTVVGCDNTPEEAQDTLAGGVLINNYYPIVGETITATWRNMSGYADPKGTPKWEWFRGETSIGRNSSTYTVVSADVGNIIKVQVSFSGENGLRDNSVKAVLNTPATATVSISMVASRSGSDFYSVDVTVTLSDGRWNPTINRFDIFDSLVTLSGTPAGINLPFASGGWTRSGNATFGIGSSFNVEYSKRFDSAPSINLTATIDPAKVAEIMSSTNVYNSLTVGTPSSVTVSQWIIR